MSIRQNIQNLLILFITSFFLLSCSGSNDNKTGSLEEELRAAGMLKDKGRIEESLSHLEKIINSAELRNQLKTSNYSLDDVLKIAGQDCYYIRDYDKALKYFKRIQNKNTVASIHFDMAVCYLAKQEIDNFFKEIYQFDKLNNNSELKKQTGLLITSVRNINDKNVSARNVFKIAWDSGVRLNSHIASYALTTLALEKGFDAPRCYYQRGVSASYIGKSSISIYDFSKAILLRNNYEYAYYERAISYLEVNMHEEAANDLNTLIQINPNSFDAHFVLGEIYLQNNQLNEAKKEYTMALNLSRKDILKKQGNIALVAPVSRMLRADRIYSESERRLQQLENK